MPTTKRMLSVSFHQDVVKRKRVLAGEEFVEAKEGQDTDFEPGWVEPSYEFTPVVAKKRNAVFYAPKKQPFSALSRAKLIAWLVQVAESFMLTKHSLFLALFLLDKFLARKTVKISKLQLLGSTCLFTASKVHEIRTVGAADFVSVSDGVFSRDDLINMEFELLRAVEYRTLARRTICEDVFLSLESYDFSGNENVTTDPDADILPHYPKWRGSGYERKVESKFLQCLRTLLTRDKVPEEAVETVEHRKQSYVDMIAVKKDHARYQRYDPWLYDWYRNHYALEDDSSCC